MFKDLENHNYMAYDAPRCPMNVDAKNESNWFSVFISYSFRTYRQILYEHLEEWCNSSVLGTGI